jgi:hypothetical protein
MILKWKPERMLFIDLIPVGDAKAKGLKPSKSSIRLFPGNNEVKDDDWAIARPHVAEHIKAGNIVEIVERTQPAPGKPVKVASKLSELPAKKARALIAETNSPDTLQEWLNTETREEVRLAVTKRMEKLKVEPKEDELGKDDEPVFDGEPAAKKLDAEDEDADGAEDDADKSKSKNKNGKEGK